MRDRTWPAQDFSLPDKGQTKGNGNALAQGGPEGKSLSCPYGLYGLHCPYGLQWCDVLATAEPRSAQPPSTRCDASSIEDASRGRLSWLGAEPGGR